MFWFGAMCLFWGKPAHGPDVNRGQEGKWRGRPGSSFPAKRLAVFDPAWSDRLLGIEVWNRKTDGWHPSHTALALFGRPGLIPFVGMDFHTRKQMFPLGMVLDLRDEVTEQSALNCLRAGRCRASAFGLGLDHKLIRGSLGFLRAAEGGRMRRFLSIENSGAPSRPQPLLSPDNNAYYRSYLHL